MGQCKMANGLFSTPCDAIDTMYRIDMSKEDSMAKKPIVQLVLKFLSVQRIHSDPKTLPLCTC